MWMDLEIIMLGEVSQTMRHQHQMLSLTCGILKKGRDELLCKTDTDSQTLKNLWFPKETGWGLGGSTEGLGWKCYKFSCDDCCTHINVIKFIKQFKNKIRRKELEITNYKEV